MKTILPLLLIGAAAACLSGPTAEDFKAQLQSQGKTYDAATFVAAASTGDLDTVDLFLKAGFDVDSALGDGSTAVMHAAEEGRLKVIERLIEAGVDLNREDHAGRRALDYATVDATNGAFDLVVLEGGGFGSLGGPREGSGTEHEGHNHD